MPQKNTRNLSTRESQKATIMTGLFLFVFCSIFIIIELGYIFFAYFSFFEHFMKERTNGTDYIFYGSYWCSSALPAFFAAIGIAACMMAKIMRYFPKADALMDQQYLANASRSLGQQSAKKLTARLDQMESMGVIAKFTWLMIIITIPFMFLDASNFKMVTKEGIIQRPYAAFHTTETKWEDITRVETGCYSFPRGGVMLRYSLVLNDGSYINLFDLEPNNSRTSELGVLERISRQGKSEFSIQDNIDQIEVVDSVLQNLKKHFLIEKFKFSVHLGEPYLNEACISGLRLRYSSQYTKIIKLLHLESTADSNQKS